MFFSDGDCLAYLSWLREYAGKYGAEVLAYCLMPNHVHLVLTPRTATAIPLLMRSVHARYAQRVNRTRDWRGHVWQGRYFSSALDEAYLWAAVRYVERNPVRARIVKRAENYRWSSAPAHCRQVQDPVLTKDCEWRRQVEGIGDWSAWLAQGDHLENLKTLRLHAVKSLPCGSQEFLASMEAKSGRSLAFRTAGRPRKGSAA